MKITASTTLTELEVHLRARGLNAEAELTATGFEVTLHTPGRDYGGKWIANATRLHDAFLALKQYDTQQAKRTVSK